MIRTSWLRAALLPCLVACSSNGSSCSPPAQEGVLGAARFVSDSPDDFNVMGYTRGSPLAVGASATIRAQSVDGSQSLSVGISDTRVATSSGGVITAIAAGTTSLLAIGSPRQTPRSPRLVPTLDGIEDFVEIHTAEPVGVELRHACDDGGSEARGTSFRYVRAPDQRWIELPMKAHAVAAGGLRLQLGDGAVTFDGDGSETPSIDASADRNDLACSVVGRGCVVSFTAAALPAEAALQIDSSLRGETRATISIGASTSKVPCDFVYLPLEWTRDDGGVVTAIDSCRDLERCLVTGTAPPDRVMVRISGTSVQAVAEVGP